MKLRCAIIEDEPQARKLLQEYVEQVAYLELVFMAPDGTSGFRKLQSTPVDLLFLDINLPGITGLELSERIGPQTKVVFITAYQEFALQGFEKNAVDYLLKPVTFTRFMQAAQKAQRLLQLEQNVQPATNSSDHQFFAKSGKRIHQLNWDDVHYIEALREYVSLVTEKEKILVYKRMKDLEDMGVPNFVRVHKSYLVNLKKIRQIEDNHILVLDARIPVSTTYRDEFFELIKGRLF